MKRSTKMLLMNRGKEKGRHFGFEYDDWRAKDRYPYPDRVEDRFRDRTGREHYDNGRYAPMSAMMEPEDRGYRRYSDGRFAPRSDMYGPDMGRYLPYHDQPMGHFDENQHWPINDRYEGRPIGFNRDWVQMGSSAASVPQYREMDHIPGHRAMRGYSDSNYSPKFDQQMADEWTSHMENEDGTNGAHWTFDQAKQVMAQRSLGYDPYEFWAALNMIYSDYVKVAKKFGVGDKIDFYVDMAKAFLDDKDAGPDKLAKYYKYIVR